IDGVEESGLLDQQQRPPPRIGKAGANPDTFVLLADSDETRRRPLGERTQQAFAGGDVRNRNDEYDLVCLDVSNVAAARKALWPAYIGIHSPLHCGSSLRPVLGFIDCASLPH